MVFFARPRNFPFSKLTRNLHLMDKFKCNEKASSCIFVMLAHIILISNQGNLKPLSYCSKVNIFLMCFQSKEM